jgi:hypothetical protein
MNLLRRMCHRKDCHLPGNNNLGEEELATGPPNPCFHHSMFGKSILSWGFPQPVCKQHEHP